MGPFLRWRAVRGRTPVEVWLADPEAIDLAQLATELERAAEAISPGLWRPLGSGGCATGERYVMLPEALPRDLRSLGEGEPLGRADALALACAVGGALQVLHEHGVVLGTLQPSHVRIPWSLPTDELPQVQVPVLPRAVRGERHAFLAPEVAQGRLSPAADQYFLGLLLCAALTGAWPGGARAPTLPEDLDAASRLLEPDPDARFGGMAEAVEVLEQLRQQHAQEAAPREQPRRSVLPWVLLAAGVGLVGLVLVALVAIVIWSVR